MSAEVRVPALGESVSEGVITRWLKREGDLVAVDEPLFELETDKATMEIPATASGRVEILAAEGATVAVGDVVARITGAASPAATPTVTASAEPPADGATGGEQSAVASSPPTAAPRGESRGSAGGVPPSPAVRRLAAEHSVDVADIAGTGKDGRATKGDVLERLEQAAVAAPSPPRELPQGELKPRASDGRQAEQREPVRDSPSRDATTRESKRGEPGPDEAAAAPRQESPRSEKPAVAPAKPVAAGAAEAGGDRREPMSRLRQRIAARLVEAQRTSAILTTFNEVDCQAVMDARRRHRERFRSVHGVDLGLMSLFSRAAVLALADVPVVNARIDGTDVVHPRHVNLGIAVSTERGLVVPVIRGAETMSLAQLERAVAELASRAREGRLVPDDLAAGTFSITNGGVFGSLLSTPILNPPQSGILGMHKIQERPVAVEGQVVIRPMMYVALSYDHRLVDGQQAVTFLVRVKERLEDPLRMLLEV